MFGTIVFALLFFTIGLVHLIYPIRAMKISSQLSRAVLVTLFGEGNISPVTVERWELLDKYPEEFKARFKYALFANRIFGFVAVVVSMLIFLMVFTSSL